MAIPLCLSGGFLEVAPAFESKAPEDSSEHERLHILDCYSVMDITFPLNKDKHLTSR